MTRLQAAKTRLDEALQAIQTERVEARASVRRRAAARDAFDEAQRGAAALFAGLARFAGLWDLAEDVSLAPAQRRSRPAAGPDADQPPSPPAHG